MTSTQPSRRGFLAAVGGVAALVAVGGCSEPAPVARLEPSRTATPLTPSGSAAAPIPNATPAITPAALPESTLWVAAAADVTPAAKLAAVRAVEQLTRWRGGGPGPRIGSGLEATSRVVDAQYGGILSSTASVLVVVDQWVRAADGSIQPTGTTVDVRLSRRATGWVVTDVFPAKPGTKAKTLTPLARSVLGNEQLRLPFAARADIASGSISAGVLTALQTLSRSHVLAISVVKSGHPLLVFGTSRPSDHPRGHAVDLWAIDGRAVVDPASRALAANVMRAGIAAGAYQAGGPSDLDGEGSQYFSDSTHQDHVHLGFHG